MAIARFATNWRSNPKSQPPEINIRPSRNPIRSNQNHQLRKCTSLKLTANSFTRVCLCAPIGPYDDVVFRNYVPPRRSSSYPPSNPLPIATETAARMSVDSGEKKVFFRGKSLKENELMRRFVAAEEEAMEKENRKRNEMEIVMKRNQIRKKMKKKKIGPSRLSRMVIAKEE